MPAKVCAMEGIYGCGGTKNYSNAFQGINAVDNIVDKKIPEILVFIGVYVMKMMYFCDMIHKNFTHEIPIYSSIVFSL